MKKAYLVGVILCLSFLVSGCMPKKDDTKTVNDQGEMMVSESEAISEDDSLEVIEEELNDTEVDDFDAELDDLDEEINQL